MKIDDIVKNRGPQLVPLPTDEKDLSPFRNALQECAYTHGAITSLFGNPWPAFSELPGYVWRCEHDERPAALLARLFQLGQEVPRSPVEAVLGCDAIERLLQREILRVSGDRLSAQVDLYECQGTLVFTDHNVGTVRFSKHVYEPGADSYTCARTTPRSRVARVLDLCTGAGLHALLAACHADSVTGVDVNERALAFARVNAAMNGMAARCRFTQGDLYQALPDDEPPFDLIVSNPPWIATPDDRMQLYRWGGETGESITRRIVEGLPRHLAPRGRLSMFVIYPVMRHSSYLERLREWLGGESGWGLTLATFTRMSLESFIASHMPGKWDWADHVREFGRWMETYARHDIDWMATGMVYVTRLSAGHPGWAVERGMPLPTRDLCGPINRWLDAMESLHGVDWPRRRLRLCEEVAHFGVDPRNGEGRVEFQPGWGPAEHLEPAMAGLVSAVCRGEAVADLEALRGLAARGIVEEDS